MTAEWLLPALLAAALAGYAAGRSDEKRAQDAKREDLP